MGSRWACVGSWKKSTVRVIKCREVTFSELEEISISSNEAWDNICLFCFTVFSRLLLPVTLAGSSSPPWSFPVELAVVQQKIKNKDGDDQGNSISVKGFLRRWKLPKNSGGKKPNKHPEKTLNNKNNKLGKSTPVVVSVRGMRSQKQSLHFDNSRWTNFKQSLQAGAQWLWLA